MTEQLKCDTLITIGNALDDLAQYSSSDDELDEKPTTSQKMYHGTIKHESKCADHTFWVYSPSAKLQNKWDTHLSVSTYCNNHIQHDKNTFICLGHTNQADFISAQKEWEKNGWNDELVTSENVDTIKMSLHIEEKVENFKKQCPDGNSFEYRRVLELGEKVENFKKLYPEGKERNDYITKLQKDYLNLLSQEKDISNQYAIIEKTGVRNISGMRVVVSIYSAGGRIYDYRNDPQLKKYEKKRDELLEPIQKLRREQAKIMDDINSIYVNMGNCNSKVPFFRSY